jgi:hypothetical protein
MRLSPSPSNGHRSGDRIKDGAVVTKRSQPEWQPTKLGRGQSGHWDPFYEFEQLARDHGEPPTPPEPSKRALLLVELLTSKAAAVVMGCVLAVVVFALLVLLVFRA